MTRAQETVLLFDVMDTLVVDPFRHEMPAFFGLTLEEMLAQKDPHAWIDFELGKIDETTFFARFFADRRAFDGAAFRAHVAAAYRYVDGIPELLEALARANVAAHTLSNYPVWYELIEARLALSAYTGERFVSFETGLRKPDPRAYLRAAEALSVPPGRCVFIDDRASNCAAAVEVGMDAIVFRDTATLRAALRERGLP